MMQGRYNWQENSARAEELGEGTCEFPRASGHHLTMGHINQSDPGPVFSGSSETIVSRAN